MIALRVLVRASVVGVALLGMIPRDGSAQTPGVPVTPAVSSLTERSATQIADSLLAAMDIGGAMSVLSARLEVAPDDFEARWRATRAALGLGILAPNRDEQLLWLNAANGHGDRLLALRPRDLTALSWAAAAKGRLALEVYDALPTARLGKEVWNLTDTLLAIDPTHALGNAVRGKLIQEVRKLSWVARLIARALVPGDLLDSAKWSESEVYLKRAIAQDPTMVLYYLDLGDTYRLQKKDAEAIEIYEKGLAVPDRYPVDPHFKNQIRTSLSTMKQDGRVQSAAGGQR